MDGTFAATDDDAARSERNAERLRDLAAARRMTMEMMARLSVGIRLPEADADEGQIKDPYLTMSRLQLGLCRIVALEQRLDESAEMRARRLVQEEAERQAAAEKATEESECRKREADRRTARAETDARKTLIRKAVREASFDLDAKMSIAEREDLIAGLFVDFEAYQDYADDPAAIVVELCCDLAVEMGCKDPMEPGGIAGLSRDATDEQRLEAMRALAQDYLDRVKEEPPDAPEPELAESG